MESAVVSFLTRKFEDCAFEYEGIECWSARELQVLLEYTDWRNFVLVIDKAKLACKYARNPIENHFVDANKMVKIGSKTKREIADIFLTRYACYLVAQNGDTRKETIAFAQTYFAIQTRKQELIEERLALSERMEARAKLTASETELSKLIYERGVDNDGFAKIRSKGDAALFGGLRTQEIKRKHGLPKNRPLADFMPTVIIAAKNLATEMTNHNVKQKNLYGEPTITSEHIQNNTAVRGMLGERGIKPEALPPASDIKKLERHFKTADKKIAKSTPQFKKLKK
ncbi:MAG: DNA damage-inducible protein D [Rickettsiales bacterium]|jgi:DNA-damage-inducible protein D|nr:DNA damage-inducible protein D [Rickettsiales bacterium]